MFNIEPNDKKNYESADAGPDCICSRCGKPILIDPVIRAWPEEMNNYPEGELPAELNYEYDYHPECLGMKTSSPEEEDFDDEEIL